MIGPDLKLRPLPLLQALTVARLHALGVSVLLRVPGDGAHVGHVVALAAGVGGVRRVARHVRGARVILWEGSRYFKNFAVFNDTFSSLFVLIKDTFLHLKEPWK